MFRFCVALLTMMSAAGVTLAAESAAITEPLTGMRFVRVPAGCFRFSGLPVLPANRDIKNSQVRVNQQIDQQVGAQSTGGEVCLPSDIWMGAYEVTQAEYSRIMGVNPSAFKKGGRYPVESVRWFDAIRFIRKLNKKTAGISACPARRNGNMLPAVAARNRGMAPPARRIRLHGMCMTAIKHPILWVKRSRMHWACMI